MVNLRIVSQVVAGGEPGPVGKSAYQAAVDNGFIGTEQEWLDSLLPFKGWFNSANDLNAKIPNPLVGDYAYVYVSGSSATYIYYCLNKGSWTNSNKTIDTSYVQTFATGQAVSATGIAEDFSGDTSDEYLVRKGVLEGLIEIRSCPTQGNVNAKVVTGLSPVAGVSFKVVMEHAHTGTSTQTQVTLKVGNTTARISWEGGNVTSTNTWSDGEIIEVFYNNNVFYAKRIFGTFKTGQLLNSVGIDSAPTENSPNLLTSGGAKESLDSLKGEIDQLESSKANKDGYYSQLTAGSAENLVGQTVDSKAYLIRPTGGTENEVANGVASVLGMEGNSCVWNQNIPDYSEITTSTSNASKVDGKLKVEFTAGYDNSYAGRFYLNNKVNIIKGHKYYSCYKVNYSLNHSENRFGYVSITSDNGTSSSLVLGNIGKGQGTNEYRSSVREAQNDSSISQSQLMIGRYPVQTPLGDWVEIWDVNTIDLTLLGIDNLTSVAQVEEWLAKHVGTKPYYAYNAGTILSSQTLGIKTYGQNLLNPTTRQAKLIPYSWEENSNVYTIKNVPSGATATFTPDATGVAETVDISGGSLDITSYGSGILELSAATDDTYVCMKWDEQKDDDVVPYEEHTQEFDVRKVYGKVNGEGSYVQCFPDGMKSADNYIDTLTTDKAIVRTGKVDLGSLTYTKDTNNSGIPYFSSTLTDSRRVSNDSHNFLTSKYYDSKKITGSNGITEEGYYLTVNQVYSGTGVLCISDKDYNSLDAVGFKNAVTGIKLIYQLATPITYTDLIYRDNGVDRPLADVLMNITVNNWSMEEQLMTPYEEGNPTSIPATISTKYGIDAVEQLDTLNKTCYFADDVHANLQALLTCINTNCAETLGGTFAISETATDKVFAFSFTPNVEPTNEGE